MGDDKIETVRTGGERRSNDEAERANGGAYPSEVDNRRAPGGDGQPPRPKSEPVESEGRSTPDPARPSDAETSRETRTDPFTGAPIDDAGQGWKTEKGGS
jgi:hypothetical protein